MLHVNDNSNLYNVIFELIQTYIGDTFFSILRVINLLCYGFFYNIFLNKINY